MRNLTVTRHASAVGALRSVKIYIEDRAVPEILICGVPCRKLGAVKNGKSATFKIPEKEAKVFAIAYKSSRNYSNGCCVISAGEEDVSLSGKCRADLLTADAFRFDQGQDATMEKARKRAWVRAILSAALFIVAMACIFFMGKAGVFDSLVDPNRDVYTSSTEKENPDDKLFEADTFSIVLNENFTPSTRQGYLVILGASDAAVFVVRESYATYPDFKDLTLEEYAQKIMEVNGLEESEVKYDGELCYFVFEALNSQSKKSYTYYGFLFDANEAKWFVHIAIPTEDVGAREVDVFKWAHSIRFTSDN